MFLVRQPIFNQNLDVYGYELLYRASAASNSYDGTNPFKSTLSVVTSLFENGLDKIVGKRKAFINFDGESLNSEIMTLITPDNLVIEVLETVAADMETAHRVETLKNKGHTT